VLQPGHGVFYNEVETRQAKIDKNNVCTFLHAFFLLIIRVRLSKRRARANSLQTCLLVKHRELTEDESFAQVCYY